MIILTLLSLLAIYKVSSEPRFVSYIGQAGPGWGTPASNEEFLKVIGVPGYGGGSLGYNILNFAFWVSTSTNGGAAVNGAAYDWQNILSRITSSSLRITLTGTSSPTADQLRAGIKAKYSEGGVKIMISAFGGADHPMNSATSATTMGQRLAQYANTYRYDGVDVDWEEAISGKFASGAGGEVWLCQLTNSLKSNLNGGMLLSHAPQAPYFMGSTSSQYPSGGYNKVHRDCGHQIDWYNVQFYNQGSTSYNSYSGLFQSSVGWSRNSGVYQIMNGASPDNVQVPANKIVVGKHTYGDGSSYVAGSTLKSIFNDAIGAGQWEAGFMTWQFYKEVYPPNAQGGKLIDTVRQANWNFAPTQPTTAPPTPPPSPTVAPSPTAQAACTTRCGSNWNIANSLCGSCCSVAGDCPGADCYADLSTTPCNNGGGNPTPRPTTPRPTDRPIASPTPRPTNRPTQRPNTSGGTVIRIRNRAGNNGWWYTCTVEDVPADVSIQIVRMKASNSDWIDGTYYNWANYWGFSAPQQFVGPFSFQVQTTAGQVVTGENIIETANAGAEGEVGSVSGGFKMSDDEKNTISWTVWFAMVVFILLAVGIIVGIVMYKRRMKKGKGYVSKTNDSVKLAENDGNKTTEPVKTEMINVNDDESDEEEQEIEIEVEAEEPITTTQ